MASEPFSFEEGAASAAPDSLVRLNETLAEAVALKEALDQLEEDAAAAKKQLTHITTSVIPDMMAEIGMDECVQNGWKIKLHQFVSGSLPKEEPERGKAIRWLQDHDASDLIKTTLTVAFTKGQHNVALDMAAKIQAEGYAPTLKEDVNAQTLGSFARERLKNGEEVDTDVLGLYTGTVAKFTMVKEPAPRKAKAK